MVGIPFPADLVLNPGPKGSNKLANLFYLLDGCSDDQIAEVYIWLGGRPPNQVDPVKLALAKISSLREDELPSFFEELRSTMSPELWKILTED